jgi:hypothetical protein
MGPMAWHGEPQERHRHGQVSGAGAAARQFIGLPAAARSQCGAHPAVGAASASAQPSKARATGARHAAPEAVLGVILSGLYVDSRRLAAQHGVMGPAWRLERAHGLKRVQSRAGARAWRGCPSAPALVGSAVALGPPGKSARAGIDLYE